MRCWPSSKITRNARPRPLSNGPIGAALAQWGAAEVARLEAGESIELEGEQIALADVLLERKAKGTGSIATDGRLTVVLDAPIDDALRREGIAREFVSLIQNARKQAGLEVSDRIKVSWSAADPEIERALGEHSSAIAREIGGALLFQSMSA